MTTTAQHTDSTLDHPFARDFKAEAAEARGHLQWLLALHKPVGLEDLTNVLETAERAGETPDPDHVEWAEFLRAAQR